MAATTITEVIAQLNEIILTAEKNADRKGYFAALYQQVTVAVAGKIKEGNYFEDNKRMEQLDVVFANRYLEAYHNYMNGQACSSCWQLAFDAATTWRPMVLDHLLLGMNAHIGLDLGIAAATVAPGDKILSLQNDFNKINILLSGLTNQVKNALFSMWPLSKLIAGKKLDGMEDSIAGFSMTLAREGAWQTALGYAALGNATEQENFIRNRDQPVTGFGNKLLHPGSFLQQLLYVFRIFEFGTVEQKIKKLATASAN